MKKYTFKHKQQVLFVTNAETHEEALDNANKENAFADIDTTPKGPYDSIPAITVVVEEMVVAEATEEVEELANA